MAMSAQEAAAVGAPVEVRDHRPSVWEMVRESWAHRDLLPRIGIRAIVKGYSGTKLGRLWLVIRPVMGIFALAFLFGAVLDAPSQGVPYVLFLLVGFGGWMTFERSVFWATRSFDVYRKLAARLDFPLLLVPTSSLVAASIELGVISVLTLLTAGYFWLADGDPYLRVGPGLLLAAAGLANALALAWGLGLWLGTLNARARDVRLTLRYVLTIWLYTTPVIYPLTALSGFWSILATVNPMAAPVEMVKAGLLGAGTVEAAGVAWSVTAALLACASGLWFITRMSPTLLRAQPAGADDEEELV